MLRLSEVTKRFGRRTVLNAVSLEVGPGEYVAVVGDSGIGKSTLLNVMAGLEPADAGEIWFQEKRLSDLDDDGVRLITTYAIAGADGLFIAKEVGGDSVDLIRLFELHARIVFEVAHTLVSGERS